MIIAIRKNILSIFVMILLLVGMSVATAGCIQEKPVYTVGLSSSLSPFAMKMPDTGEAYGIDVDILDAIAESQGVRFVYEFCEHADYHQKLESGDIDLVTAYIKTPERQEEYLFSDAYTTVGYALAVKKNANITLDDILSGNATIACQKGSTYESWLQEHFGQDTFNTMVDEKKIIIKYTQDATVYAVLANEAETVIAADSILAEKLREYSPLTFLGYLTDKKDSAFAADKSNTELIAIINAGLKDITASGEYDKILQKYRLIQPRNEYRVGISTENPPFTYLDENGDLTGFDTESLQWIAEKNGFDVTFVEVPWSKNINALITGKIDMWYSGMPITKNRLARATFSTPYYTAEDSYGVAVKNGDIPLQDIINKGLADLETSGKRAELLEKYHLS